MCKNCYLKYVEQSKSDMLFCILKNKEKNELMKLCHCQRFCSDLNKYIEHKQERCRNYVYYIE